MIVFVDTETTGLDEEDQIIQLCYLHNSWEKPKSEYFMTLQPISIEAKCVSHITEKMLEGKEFLENSEMANELSELLKTNILVAHNAPFDIAMLRKDKIETHEYIDTRRVASHVLPDCNSHSLQYLRYYLEVQGTFNAHDAEDDVLLLACVFERLVDEVSQKYKIHETEGVYRKMIELSKTPVKLKKITFGKHKGKTFEEVAKNEMSYLQWLKRERKKTPTEQYLNRDKPNQEEEDLDYTLRCYVP